MSNAYNDWIRDNLQDAAIVLRDNWPDEGLDLHYEEIRATFSTVHTAERFFKALLALREALPTRPISTTSPTAGE